MGSTLDDVNWAYISNTTEYNQMQWLSTVVQASFGEGGSLYDPQQQKVVFLPDSGTTALVIDVQSFNKLLAIASANGTPCVSESDMSSIICTCVQEDCSDFPSLNIEVLESSESGKTFNISLDSTFTMRRIASYQYRLMISGIDVQSLGAGFSQWIFGQDFFHKYYTIFDYA